MHITRPWVVHIRAALDTRYIGIAVLRDAVLLDWGVSVIPRCQSPQAKLKKARSLVSRLIAEYEPGILVIKKLHPSRRSIRLQQLTRDIRQIGQRKGLQVHQYSIQEMEAFFAPDSRINKRKLCELICLKYPALRRELRKEQNSNNPYHIRMFEAVALAMLAQSSDGDRSGYPDPER